jgi:hypothetical protein
LTAATSRCWSLSPPHKHAMARLVVYAIVGLVAIGALLAGTLPNSPASVVHDAIAGWHWLSTFLHAHAGGR